MHGNYLDKGHINNVVNLRFMPGTLLNLSYSLTDIKKAAGSFWEAAKPYRIIAFSGQLGAGKTTFIHALCELLNVEDNVSSPTFALINEYHFKDDSPGADKVIYHMDWYRLKSTEEAINAGMEDCLLQQNAYCFIEWPEKAPELLPSPHLWVTIDNKSETERDMQVCLNE